MKYKSCTIFLAFVVDNNELWEFLPVLAFYDIVSKVIGHNYLIKQTILECVFLQP